MGLFGNLAVIRILYPLRKSLSAKIFLAIAGVDITTSIFGAIPFSLPRLFPDFPGAFSVTVLCNLCGALLNISERYSVFLIAILSVTRAIALRYPLFYIKSGRVLVAMVIYFIFQACLACLPLFHGKFYFYDDVYTVCTWFLDDILDINDQYHLYQLTYHFLLFIPFFLPSIFVVSSCVVCVVSLKNQRVVADANDSKAKASMTIVMFTLTYIILHVPLWIFLVMFLVTEHGQVSVDFGEKVPLYLFIFSSKVSVFINAAMNPFLYLGRVSSMKKSFGDEVKKIGSFTRRITAEFLRRTSRLDEMEITTVGRNFRSQVSIL